MQPLALSVALLIGSAVAAPLDFKTPSKRPVTAATAKTYLAALTVAVESNSPAYSRDLFPTWDIISGNCDTRETVLKRDGTGVVTDSSSNFSLRFLAGHLGAGCWVAPYDGAKWTAASDVDIDHVVPLKEVWMSGARTWTTARREALANDLTRPQLVAVTDNVNESKGDKDPAEWMPPLASYHCTYVRAWITVKHYYDLTIDSAEKTALTNYLASC